MTNVLPPNSIRNAPISPSRRIEEPDESRIDPALKAGAEALESMFIEQLFQAMRKTIPESEESLDSGATDIYRGMLDTELSQQAAKQGGFGISRQIIANLSSAGYNNYAGEPPHKVSPAKTGGLNED